MVSTSLARFRRSSLLVLTGPSPRMLDDIVLPRSVAGGSPQDVQAFANVAEVSRRFYLLLLLREGNLCSGSARAHQVANGEAPAPERRKNDRHCGRHEPGDLLARRV